MSLDPHRKIYKNGLVIGLLAAQSSRSLAPWTLFFSPQGSISHHDDFGFHKLGNGNQKTVSTKPSVQLCIPPQKGTAVRTCVVQWTQTKDMFTEDILSDEEEFFILL